MRNVFKSVRKDIDHQLLVVNQLIVSIKELIMSLDLILVGMAFVGLLGVLWMMLRC